MTSTPCCRGAERTEIADGQSQYADRSGPVRGSQHLQRSRDVVVPSGFPTRPRSHRAQNEAARHGGVTRLVDAVDRTRRADMSGGRGPLPEREPLGELVRQLDAAAPYELVEVCQGWLSRRVGAQWSRLLLVDYSQTVLEPVPGHETESPRPAQPAEPLMPPPGRHTVAASLAGIAFREQRVTPEPFCPARVICPARILKTYSPTRGPPHPPNGQRGRGNGLSHPITTVQPPPA